MRATLPAVLLLLTACDSMPKAAQPRINVSPYFAAYRLGGKIGMQDRLPSGTPDNSKQSLRSMGLDRYEDDYGIRTDFGDGTSGVRAEWYRLSMHPTDSGVLSDDFGALPAGSTVQTGATMDEFRVGYLHEVWVGHGGPTNSLFEIRIAAGGVLAHRSLDLDVEETSGGLRQDLSLDDRGVLYPAAHFHASRQSFAIDLDYAISPNLQFGGDYGGIFQDIEARISYTVPFQDISLFAGYRFSTLPLDGGSGGLDVDGNLRLDGVQLGVTVTF